MRFFFYGTLMQAGCNDFAAWLHQRLKPGVPASAMGRLYRVRHDGQWHRALVCEPGGRAIPGMVFEADDAFGADALAALDDYEDFNPAFPERGDYRRAEVAVETAVGVVMAQTYVWNRPLDAQAREIAD
jgi:gamma-glutamylcyclotransferase (GGCT)/AIG2-like uncharacterized protein YtfP